MRARCPAGFSVLEAAPFDEAVDARRVHRRSKSGVTLLELTIVLIVLAFGLLAVATAQMHAMRGGRTDPYTTQAAMLAENQMQQMERWRWDDPKLAPTHWNWSALTTIDVAAKVGDGIEHSYGVQWRIVEVVPDERRAIDVRVIWNEPKRSNRSYSISRVRYNDERL